MTRAEHLLPDDEQARRTECAQEPIHLAGAIQPHGALLAVDQTSWTVVQASANTGSLLAIAADQLLGQPLTLLFDDPAPAQPAALLAAARSGSNPVPVRVAGRALDAIVHELGELMIVEFEAPAAVAGDQQVLDLYSVIRQLSAAADADQLRAQAAAAIRQLTGFDQVMIYGFHPDGHGEVLADDHAAGMQPYLGLHFPASDIPAQARRLYLTKASQLIANSDYVPAALVPSNNPHMGAPLDLSTAELRSVSPFHLQFMRNMGQGASLTLPLVHSGQLHGMITCAHRAPRHVPYALRRGYEVLAQQISLRLVAMEQTHRLARRLQTQQVRTDLVEQMIGKLDVAGGLVKAGVTVLDLITADGAAMRLRQQLTSIGHAPSDEQITALLDTMPADPLPAPLVTDSVRIDYPALADLVPSVAGLVVLPFGGSGGDCLLWFRREVAQSVAWLGAQDSTNRTAPLSPRTSFQMWTQAVTDRSLAWDEAEIAEAVQLRRDIDNVLLRRAEAQLSHMGLHDALTGLPNRNLLMDRITSTLARAERINEQVVVLFCDLDGFKRVNDTAGHAAGDAVLVEVANRLRAVLRSGDSVARVGGDEFVIVLEPAPRDTASEVPDDLGVDLRRSEASTARPYAGAVAASLAERIRVELARPITHDGQDHVVSVSVGMTFALAGTLAEEVLRDADTAMYRAKHGGKDRVEVFDESMRAEVVHRAAIEQTLRSALLNAGPTPHRAMRDPVLPHLGVAYQPVIDLATGRLVSFEALARLRDGAGKRVRPREFISVAEETGLITGLGEVVLEAALGCLVQWRAAHPDAADATVAVNFSARQAQHANMPKLVHAALERHLLHPTDLTLELTETVLMEAGSSTLRQIAELHEAGVGVAIDDFGTGYASLRHLAVLPVDCVKIDKSFTAGLPHDATCATIVRAVTRLASDMRLQCVVEGIETAGQLGALPDGVLGQGFLLGRPDETPRDDWVRPRR